MSIFYLCIIIHGDHKLGGLLWIGKKLYQKAYREVTYMPL